MFNREHHYGLVDEIVRKVTVFAMIVTILGGAFIHFSMLSIGFSLAGLGVGILVCIGFLQRMRPRRRI